MSANKKVLIASGSRHTIPPVHNSPGVPRIIFQLAEREPEGFQFVVLSKYDKALDPSTFNSNKYLHPKPNLGTLVFERFLKIMPYRWRKQYYGLAPTDRIIYYTALVQKAEQLKPDIIITFMHLELFIMLQKALPHAKHIFFFRSTDLKGRIGEDNIQYLLKNSAGFLANTKAPIEELKSLDPTITFPMATIYNAVSPRELDLAEQKETRAMFRKKFGLNTEDFVLGYAGRFSEEKSLLEIFRAMKEIKEEGKTVHLIIAGDIANEKTPDQKYYAELMAYREAYLSEQVHFAGWITNADLYHFYCAIDVGILLSKYREGNSMFLIEAMSYGVPVIATAVGGNKEIITSGFNGILIDLETLESDLKKSIVILLEDPDIYKSMSDEARMYTVKNHSVETMIQRFHDFLKKL